MVGIEISEQADTSAVQREERRLQALDRYDLLDTPREDTFDRLVRLAKRIFRVEIATISLLDAHRQWFKACEGFPGLEMPRDVALCNYTIQHEQPLVVEDATKDARFADNVLVTGEMHLRFYAGVPLRSGDGQNVGTLCLVDREPRAFRPEEVEILWDLGRLVVDTLEMRLLATKDSLTGALTRRTFKEQVHRVAALARRHTQELTCLMLDLDHFKSINDRYGHPVGDLVLGKAAAVCASTLRATDYLGRLGGEEFAVLLPGTGSGGGYEAAEKLRCAIERMNIEHGGDTIRVSASVGVASLDGASTDDEALLRHADLALYEAKAKGRNRCEIWHDPLADASRGRRRTLKAGQILFNGRRSAIDCTIRSLSEEGACLAVSNTLGVPRKFDLAIKAEGAERACRVLAQTEKQIDVVFC